MPEVSHGFEGFLLIFLLDVTGGECLLYKKLIFLRNNSKNKSESFLYLFIFLYIVSQFILQRSAKKLS